MPHEEFVVMMMLLGSGIALVFFFAVPLRKAWLRKIEGGVTHQDHQVLDEVDGLRERVGELEERLDFAERLIAQQRDTAGLPPGGSR
ncbi:MAG: hypothetical protein R2910_04060 [Gemmatimonadales bacterium]